MLFIDSLVLSFLTEDERKKLACADDHMASTAAKIQLPSEGWACITGVQRPCFLEVQERGVRQHMRARVAPHQRSGRKRARIVSPLLEAILKDHARFWAAEANRGKRLRSEKKRVEPHRCQVANPTSSLTMIHAILNLHDHSMATGEPLQPVGRPSQRQQDLARAWGAGPLKQYLDPIDLWRQKEYQMVWRERCMLRSRILELEEKIAAERRSWA